MVVGAYPTSEVMGEPIWTRLKGGLKLLEPT